MKKLTALVLCLLFILPCGTIARAAQTINYVSLGDSIAAGFGLEEGQGYPELLAGKLVKEGGFASVSLENLAHSGDDTQDLLQLIETDKDKIAKADIVTICIGGNNFLGTLVDGMTSALGLTDSDLQEQGIDIGSMDLSDERFEIAAKGLQTPQIQAALAKGIAQFRADFPKIILNIHDLAPNAKIYAMTVYDPLEPDQPVYPILDPVEVQINATIKATKGITVVDAYAAYEDFANKPQLSLGGVDPHPSVDGQRVLANEYFKAITGKESGDIVKANAIAVGAVSPPASVAEATPTEEPVTAQTFASGSTETSNIQMSAVQAAKATATENVGNHIAWLILIPVLILAAAVLYFIFRKV